MVSELIFNWLNLLVLIIILVVFWWCMVHKRHCGMSMGQVRLDFIIWFDSLFLGLNRSVTQFWRLLDNPLIQVFASLLVFQTFFIHYSWSLSIWVELWKKSINLCDDGEFWIFWSNTFIPFLLVAGCWGLEICFVYGWNEKHNSSERPIDPSLLLVFLLFNLFGIDHRRIGLWFVYGCLSLVV